MCSVDRSMITAGPLHCRAALLAVRSSVSRGRTILILGPCNAGKTALWLQVQARTSACLLLFVKKGQCATLLGVADQQHTSVHA
jgi:chloramphenicol 3-O-phosphotransferase